MPEHGDRKNLPELCKPELCIPDLQAALAYAQTKWREIALFANSLGAYFSLRAYPAAKLKRALFLSPLLDMERMIRNMMTWFHVSEERLRQEKEIPTPMGQTLYWDYYCDVKANPILDWPVPTDILYGEKDELCERDTVDAFLGRFGGTLEVLAGSEHFSIGRSSWRPWNNGWRKNFERCKNTVPGWGNSRKKVAPTEDINNRLPI